MNISRRVTRDGVTLALAGELDLSTVALLLTHVEQVTAGARPDRLVVDLAAVTFCDSTGVGALIDARAATTGRGVRFQVTHPRGITRRVLRVTGVLDLLTLPADG